MRAIGFLVLAALLSGCAGMPPAQREAMRARLTEGLPVCAGEEECRVKWEMAQLFVIHHAGFKIQTATSVLIETYNPTDSSPSLAMRITREPKGNGFYGFTFAAWCANIFGCNPDPYAVWDQFNRELAVARP